MGVFTGRRCAYLIGLEFKPNGKILAKTAVYISKRLFMLAKLKIYTADFKKDD